MKTDENWEVIHTYSRAEAIDDGSLVDVSTLAKEAGFTYPVAMTRASWCKTVEVPTGLEHCQDETGRLWDVLSVMRYAAKHGGSVMHFDVITQTSERERPMVTLKAICGPGDTLAPVITIMLPEED
jgi:hypothetical protein